VATTKGAGWLDPVHPHRASLDPPPLPLLPKKIFPWHKKSIDTTPRIVYIRSVYRLVPCAPASRHRTKTSPPPKNRLRPRAFFMPTRKSPITLPPIESLPRAPRGSLSSRSSVSMFKSAVVFVVPSCLIDLYLLRSLCSLLFKFCRLPALCLRASVVNPRRLNHSTLDTTPPILSTSPVTPPTICRPK